MSEDSGSVSIGPHNLDAERAVLGCLMLENPAIFVVAGLIEVSDFYLEGHRAIFEAIQAQAEAGRPWDPSTICECLDDRDHTFVDDVPDDEPIGCLIGKHRNGPTGTVSLTLRRPTTEMVEREIEQD